METYGKRLSTTLKINYMYFAYLIPVILIVTGLMTYLLQNILYIIVGFFSFIFLILIATQGDQSNSEAFENGLKIPVTGGMFRIFVPYRNIVYVCSFKYDFLVGKATSGLVIIINDPHRDIFFRKQKYNYSTLWDGKQIPFDLVIPCMKKKARNWQKIYHPEIVIESFHEVQELCDKWNSKEGQ